MGIPAWLSMPRHDCRRRRGIFLKKHILEVLGRDKQAKCACARPGACHQRILTVSLGAAPGDLKKTVWLC